MGLSDKIVIMKDGLIQQVGSPREIYQKPINAFVAGFIGQANTIKGKIMTSSDKSYEVDIYGVLHTINSDHAYKIGDEVEMIVRPESVIVGTGDFQGIVTKSIFMGENHEYEVEWMDQIVQITESNPFGKKAYELGDTMNLSFDVSALHIL
jgi:iron(III) transport system ATP-binding protein